MDVWAAVCVELTTLGACAQGRRLDEARLGRVNAPRSFAAKQQHVVRQVGRRGNIDNQATVAEAGIPLCARARVCLPIPSHLPRLCSSSFLLHAPHSCLSPLLSASLRFSPLHSERTGPAPSPCSASHLRVWSGGARASRWDSGKSCLRSSDGVRRAQLSCWSTGAQRVSPGGSRCWVPSCEKLKLAHHFEPLARGACRKSCPSHARATCRPTAHQACGSRPESKSSSLCKSR